MQLMNIIKSASDASMIWKDQTPQRHEPTYWWNENSANAGKECLKARRKYQRSRGTESFSVLQETYREILEICKSIKDKKASEPDGIPNKAFKPVKRLEKALTNACGLSPN